MTKKRITILAGSVGILLILLLLLTIGMNAYFVSQEDAVNQVRVGENVTEIEEEYDPPQTMEADSDYTKKVTVRNQKAVPCYVRVSAEITPPIAEAGLEVDWNQTDWTEKQEDGYYYYKNVLPVGETTEPLLTELHATEELDDFSMIVYSESIQSEGFDSPQEAFASYEEGVVVEGN